MFMAYRAKFWKKVRRWLGRKMLLSSESGQHAIISQQVGKLLQHRGSELITMTTL